MIVRWGAENHDVTQVVLHFIGLQANLNTELSTVDYGVVQGLQRVNVP